MLGINDMPKATWRTAFPLSPPIPLLQPYLTQHNPIAPLQVIILLIIIYGVFGEFDLSLIG